MKVACAAAIGLVALFFSACVTGDEITSYVIEPDGSVSFSMYLTNLTSDEAGEKGRADLANWIQEREEKRADVITHLMNADAREVQVAILRRASPASILITGRISSLNDFAAFMNEEGNEEGKEGGFVCTAISRENTLGLLFEFKQNPSKEDPQSTHSMSGPDPFSVTRFSLAEGRFTSAQGFFLEQNNRSARIDQEALNGNSQSPSVTLALEWERQ